MDPLAIAEQFVHEPTHPAARAALFSAVYYQPLNGLTARGAGNRQPQLRSVKTIPHVRVHLTETDLKAKWHERLTGREFFARVPAGHGVEVAAGKRFKLDPGIVQDFRAAAQHEIARDRAWARTQFGTAVPESGAVPVGNRRSGGESLWAALDSYPGWASLEVVYRRVADHREATLTLIDEAGERTRAELIDQLGRELEKLREAQTGPGVGAPFSIFLRAQHSPEKRHWTELNWDHEPSWETPVDPSNYWAEQEKHPRTEPWIPDWLLLRLREGERG